MRSKGAELSLNVKVPPVADWVQTLGVRLPRLGLKYNRPTRGQGDMWSYMYVSRIRYAPDDGELLQHLRHVELRRNQ